MFHDVPAEVLATGTPKGEQSQRPFRDLCTFVTWPATSVVSGRDDRCFPEEFQRTLARARLGIDPVVIPGGHLMALSQPEALTATILQAAS